MLFRTFQLIPGVGPWREKDLWARGVLTWEDVPSEGAAPAVSVEVDSELRERIGDARAALGRGDLSALVQMLPKREHWRLYPHFADRAAFFDVEADGDRVPTVVTVFDRSGIRTFIRGRNLEDLPAALAESELWVTFNGGSFDIPVLKVFYGDLPEPTLHLDLKVLARKLKLGGGLKPVEDAIGIGRPVHLRGVGGLQAVELWRVYEDTADLDALRLLVEYNAYDAINLRSVAEIGFNRLADHLAFDDRIPVFERGEVLYDLSKLLLGLQHTGRDLLVLDRIAPRDRQIDG
jgi:uncharacterized protein YprB with RNaseH-like and TPR domain